MHVHVHNYYYNVYTMYYPNFNLQVFCFKRHRALQTGRIYVRQNPHDADLTVDKLNRQIHGCLLQGHSHLRPRTTGSGLNTSTEAVPVSRHSVAWLEDAPDVEKVLATGDSSSQQELIRYIDKTVTTISPAVLPDGSNVSDAPLPKTNPHVCNKAYSEVEDHHQDLCDLIATCQRHTRCSAAYCLRTKHGVQQ